jgi:hypothetical protein
MQRKTRGSDRAILAPLFDMVKSAANVTSRHGALCVLRCYPDLTRTGKRFSAVSAWLSRFRRRTCIATQTRPRQEKDSLQIQHDAAYRSSLLAWLFPEARLRGHAITQVPNLYPTFTEFRNRFFGSKTRKAFRVSSLICFHGFK